MRKVNVLEFVSLDGVIQAPGGPDNRFPPPNVIGNIFSQNASTKSCFMSV